MAKQIIMLQDNILEYNSTKDFC